MARLGIDLPIYRDPEGVAARALGVDQVPTNLILGPNHIVQDYEMSGNLSWIEAIPRLVDVIASGRAVYEEQQQSFAVLKAEYQRIFQWMVKNDLYVSPEAVVEAMKRSGLAERSEPKSFRLKRLWKTEAS